MEDSSIRAITIGVGLFVVLLTISAIVGYVTVARGMATAVDQGLRLDEVTYKNILDYEDNVTIDARGIDVRNFIRKHLSDENIRTIKIIENSVVYLVDKDLVFDSETNNVSSAYLFKIDANAKVTMTKNTDAFGKINISIEGPKVFIPVDPTIVPEEDISIPEISTPSVAPTVPGPVPLPVPTPVPGDDDDDEDDSGYTPGGNVIDASDPSFWGD